jgi:hypothetical protein
MLLTGLLQAYTGDEHVSEVSSKLDGMRYFFAPLLLEGREASHGKSPPEEMGGSVSGKDRLLPWYRTRVLPTGAGCGRVPPALLALATNRVIILFTPVENLAGLTGPV